jgi:vacuolar-type H+-ATPase subunit H
MIFKRKNDKEKAAQDAIRTKKDEELKKQVADNHKLLHDIQEKGRKEFDRKKAKAIADAHACISLGPRS